MAFAYAAAGVAGAAPAADAAAQPRVFYVQADAHVSASAPRTDYRRRPRLELRAKPVQRAYLRFQVHGLTGPVTSARLRVRSLSASRVGFEAHSVAGRGWRVRRLTWRAAPRMGRRLASSGRVAAGKWVSLDVTRAVRGNGVVTLALTTRSPGRIRIASREGARWAVARLELTVGSAVAARRDGAGAGAATFLGDGALIAPVPAPVPTEAPAISGHAWEKRALTATPGVWTGTPSEFAYQWRRCDADGRSCADIADATDATYRVDSKDLGGTLRVVVRAANPGGEGSTSSEPTEVVTKAPPTPTARKSPSISGRAQEGLILTARPGTWKGAEPMALEYQWQRCDAKGGGCVPVDGATTTTYGLTAGDLGSTLRVAVTAANIAGSTTLTTKATDKVTPPPPPPTVGVVGLWHMDELSGTAMIDSSGLGNDGKLRSVQLNQPGFIGRGYYFNGSSSVVTIPSNASLNPGTRDFSFGLNLRFWSHPSGSVDTWDPMRKGYSDSSGGDFKMEIYPNGEISCYFKGAQGNARVTNDRDLADGGWHTVTCRRRGGSVKLEVDGKSFSDSGGVGAISNSAPLMVGARTSGMEFFKGYIDEAHMTVE